MAIKVLYYSIVNLADLRQSNGGNICCRNHLVRLKEDADLEVHVALAGSPKEEAANVKFLTDFGVPYIYVPFRRAVVQAKPWQLPRVITNWLRRRFSYPFEDHASSQPHIEKEVLAAYRRWNIEAVIVDYLPSMLYCPALLSTPNVILITLNREAEFYQHQLDRKLIKRPLIEGLVSRWRWARYERRVYQSVSNVVAIGPPDIPRGRKLRSRPVCVTPYLDPKPEPWSFTDSRCAWFVGNIAHYPNRLAIEWIATQLAPRAHAQRPDVQFVIVGAAEAQTPPEWRHPAVKYLGAGDRATVDQLFRTADLMLCPIENDFGMKFKAAEAIAYGTPMLASRQTLLGIPYLHGTPSIDLDNPAHAAQLVCDLVGQRAALEELSAAQLRQARQFLLTQKNVWSTHVRRVLSPAAA